MTRRSLSIAFCLSAAIVLATCQDDRSSPLAPDAVTAPPGPPSALISDAAHLAGNSDFFFLPPLVPDPSGHPDFEPDAFDATLEPAIRICELTDEACTTPQPDGFPLSYAFGDGGDAVRLSLDPTTGDGLYVFDWDTKAVQLDESKDYRIHVDVAGSELGYADVDVVRGGGELKNVATGTLIGLVDGRTLPVKFRIEQGAVYVTGPAGGTVTTPDGTVRLEIPEDALVSPVGLTIRPLAGASSADGPVEGTIFEFGPDGLTFAEPVVLSIAYSESGLPPGTDEFALGIHKFSDGMWQPVENSSADPEANQVSGTIRGFSAYSVAPYGATPLDFRVWTSVRPDATGRLRLSDVWASSATNAWAVGHYAAPWPTPGSAAVLHFDGMSWQDVTPDIPELATVSLAAVFGTGEADIWAVGEDGTVLRYDGASWALVPSPTTAHLGDVWAGSPDRVWMIATAERTLYGFDGTAWTEVQPPSGSHATVDKLWGLGDDGVGGDRLVAVGRYGTIWEYSGGVLIDRSRPSNCNHFTDVYAHQSGGYVWIVEGGCGSPNSGRIWRFNSSLTSGGPVHRTYRPLGVIHGSAANYYDVIAAGWGYDVWHLNGGSYGMRWLRGELGAADMALGAWVNADSSAFIVAAGGNIHMSVEVPHPASIEIWPPMRFSAYPGTVWELETYSLYAEVRDALGRAMRVPVQWSTSDSSVGYVTVYGNLMTRSAGKTILTATSGSLSASVPVTVRRRVQRLTIDPERFEVAMGETGQLRVKALDRDGEPIEFLPLEQLYRWRGTMRYPSVYVATVDATQDPPTVTGGSAGYVRGYLESVEPAARAVLEIIVPGAPDTYEPNDAIGQAYDLGTLMGDAGPSSVTGTFHHPEVDSEDWYRVSAEELPETDCSPGAAQSLSLRVRLDDTDRQRVYHQWGSPGLAFAVYLETAGESTLLGSGAAGEEVGLSVAGQCGVADVFPVLVRVTAPATDYPSDYRYTLTLEFLQP